MAAHTGQRAVQIIAHRGASVAERENTLVAFRRAAELGAHAVELDVRRGADGSLVIHHDAHLADGRAVAALAVGDLPGHIPTLGAALDACEGMWVNIEIKSDSREEHFDSDRRLADLVVDLLKQRDDPPDRWVISSFDRLMIDRVYSLWPPVSTAWLTLDAGPGIGVDLAEAGHQALHPNEAFVTPEMVADCHQAGIVVNTWTCDDPDRMATLAGWGIDGICTNVPDVAVVVLGAQPGG